MPPRERKVPDFSPNDLEQIEAIKEKVLKPPGEAAPSSPMPAPRPKLPNFYKHGGAVRVSNYCAGGKVISSRRA